MVYVDFLAEYELSPEIPKSHSLYIKIDYQKEKLPITT